MTRLGLSVILPAGSSTRTRVLCYGLQNMTPHLLVLLLELRGTCGVVEWVSGLLAAPAGRPEAARLIAAAAYKCVTIVLLVRYGAACLLAARLRVFIQGRDGANTSLGRCPTRYAAHGSSGTHSP